VGNLKGVGRIHQRTFADTHTKVAFAELYDRKTPIKAADLLNDRVIPFFERSGCCGCYRLQDRVLRQPDHSRTKTKRSVRTVWRYQARYAHGGMTALGRQEGWRRGRPAQRRDAEEPGDEQPGDRAQAGGEREGHSQADRAFAAGRGLRTTLLTLLFMALLRIKRPEHLKERDPAAFGRLLGLDRAPEVEDAAAPTCPFGAASSR
jgi:hypothetical protein